MKAEEAEEAAGASSSSAPAEQAEVGWAPTVGLLAMLGGAFCFSLMAMVATELGTASRYAIVRLRHKYAPFELVFWRALFMLIITMSTLVARGINPLGPRDGRTRFILSVRGLCGVGFMACFYYALSVIPISDAVVLTYTSPVLTAAAAALLLGEVWHGLDALGAAFCMAGVVLISKPPLVLQLLGLGASAAAAAAPGPQAPAGFAAAFLAALFATAVYVIIRVLKEVHSVVFVNYLAMAGVVAAPVIGMGLLREEWFLPNLGELALLVLLALLATVGETLAAFGLKLETAAKATSMNYVQVAFAFVFQSRLHEVTDWWSVAGTVLIATWGLVALIKEAMGHTKRPEEVLPGTPEVTAAAARYMSPGGSVEEPLLGASAPDVEEGVAKAHAAKRGPSVGLLAMVAGAFFFSLMALMVKYLSEFGTYELVFWRSLFMVVGTTSMLTARGISPMGPRGSRLYLAIRGIAGFVFMSSYYYAIKRLPLSDAVVICYTSPVVTAVAAALFLGEAWGRLDALGCALCLVGVMLVSKPSFIMSSFGAPSEPLPLNGVLAAVVSSVMSTVVYLLVRLLRGVHPIVFVHYFAAAGIVLGPIASHYTGEKWTGVKGDTWPLLVLLAVLSILGQALMNIGLTLETAAKATAMNYAQVVFALLFQVGILHETTDTLSMFGAVMIAAWGVIALFKEPGEQWPERPTEPRGLAEMAMDRPVGVEHSLSFVDHT